MPFIPTDIAGCSWWIDFSDATKLFVDAGTTPVNADAQAIYQANDKSGNNFHVTQATAGARPTYKTGIQNSKSIGRFDGGDRLISASVQLVGADGAYTFFSCQNVTNVTDYRGVATQDTVTRVAQFLRYVITSGYLQSIVFNTVNAAFIATYDSYLSDFAISSVIRTTTTIRVFGNGTAGTSVDTTGTPRNSATTAGVGVIRNTGTPASDLAFLGDIGEIIVYNSALSDPNRQLVESYLNTKWAAYTPAVTGCPVQSMYYMKQRGK